MSSVAVTITGAQGQGIDSVGGILARACKRSGRCVFAYREYMSLIKGGHSRYQIDIADRFIGSSVSQTDLLLTLNHHGFEHDLKHMRPGGIVLHDQEGWKFSSAQQAWIAERNLRVVAVPVHALLRDIGGTPLLRNVVLAAFAWSMFGEDRALLADMVKERYARKEDVLAANMRAIDAGIRAREEQVPDLTFALPPADARWKDRLLLSGSQAMGLGLVRAGMRAFFSYPMTPASPLLTVIADLQNETGILVKQAEDEITAAQMMSGAMFMGTRAATATSGGGFDLMTETLSMNAIAENPALFILAQRPGPGTGLPTWTAQGDLHMAIHCGHGEFARGVLAVSDANDAYSLMNDAFNTAETLQTPVIVLTDKHVAEGIFTQEPFAAAAPTLSRGLVTDPAALASLQSADRYDPTAATGVSPRWLPGSHAATYAGQADEHRGDGSVEESADNAGAQMDKRLRKMKAMKAALPEPVLYEVVSRELRVVSDDVPEVDILIVGWGSSKGAILDALLDVTQDSGLNTQDSIGFLHYSWLWPLKTDRFERLAKQARKIVLIEGNAQGQLGRLLRQETGIEITEKILKYDGRPFFRDELAAAIRAKL